MLFLGWMYDVAREQSPDATLLANLIDRSADVGYHALALYLEHRYAYPSAPWAAAPGALTPDLIRQTQAHARSRGVRLVPFINTLGHMEGFIRAEGGQWLAEGESGYGGEQICATRPECAAFARGLIDDILAAFDDEWLHLGGDEPWQLGQCPACAARVAKVGAGVLYGAYMGALCRHVLARGRRPCLWGDVLLQHADAMPLIPRETLIFDWQYAHRPRESLARLRAAGFDVVCCPSLKTWNSAWCFLPESQQNIDAHHADAQTGGALGVLLTTWNFTHFSAYEDIWPVVFAAGRRLAHGDDWSAAITDASSTAYARAADILGRQIPTASPFLAPGTWRRLRENLVVWHNPFLLWQRWRSEACGPIGDELRRLCGLAGEQLTPGTPLSLPIELHRVAIDWVRAAESAYQEYVRADLPAAATRLGASAPILARLEPLVAAVARAGGSTADVGRLAALTASVHRAAQRIRKIPTGQAFRPAFHLLGHDFYVEGDQAAWATRPPRQQSD